METYQEFLVFSPDYCNTIAFVSTKDAQDSFSVDVDWDFPLNNAKPKMFMQNNEKADNCEDGEEDGKQNNEKEEKGLHNMAVCESKHLLAFTTNEKSLMIFKIDGKTAKIVSRRSFWRTSSCIRFSPCGNLLFLADKTGDVFEYQCDEENINARGKWIFGHISQILDLQITPILKYILTADRDEKIRVTNYPKTHEIETFCLGHKEFVSGLSLISEGYMLSISGDKSLKLWDYVTGKELSSHSFSFVPLLIKTISLTPESGFICVSTIAHTVHILKYSVDKSENCTLAVQNLAEKQYKSDIEIAVRNQEFHILYIQQKSESATGVFIDRVEIDDKTATFINIFDNKRLSATYINVKTFKSFDVPLLFKNSKMFDNLKAYNDRKKARIESGAIKK